MFSPFSFFVAAVAVYVCSAAVSDFRFQRIPNYITVPSAATALVFNLAVGMFGMWEYNGFTGLAASLTGFALGLALLFLPFAMGGGGAGDVKFLAALGTWLGPWHLFMAFALGMVLAMFAGLYKWAMIASSQGPWKAKEALGAGAMPTTKLRDKKRRKTYVAFVVPFAVSCLIILGMMALQKSSGQPPNPWWISTPAVSPS